MKKFKLLLSVCFVFSYYIVSSQTYESESKNMARLFSEGLISTQEYQQYAVEWKKLIEDFNGYPELPFNEKSERIEFVVIDTFENLDKRTIYNRALEWSALRFGNLSTVMQYSNYEDGKIIIKGWFNVVHKANYQTFFLSSKEKLNSVKCYFSLIFTVKEGKMKTELTNITYKYEVSHSLSGNTYIPSYDYEQSIMSFYPVTDGQPIEWKGRLDLLKETNERIQLFTNDIEYYINNYSRDYTF